MGVCLLNSKEWLHHHPNIGCLLTELKGMAASSSQYWVFVDCTQRNGCIIILIMGVCLLYSKEWLHHHPNNGCLFTVLKGMAASSS
jgi:hypothetical protein